jgi:hypothetical protein
VKTNFDITVTLECDTTDSVSPDDIEKWLDETLNQMHLQHTILDKEVSVKLKKVITIDKYKKTTE